MIMLAMMKLSVILLAALLGRSVPQPASPAAPSEPTAPAPPTTTRTGSPTPMRIPVIGGRMVYVPAGEFDMGSPAAEPGRRPDECTHRVRIAKALFMSATEITQEQWITLMGDAAKPWTTDGKDLPATGLSREQAELFCTTLSKKSKQQFRLPTEAEWEYAARAGEIGPYSGGSADEVAWHAGNSGGTIHPVGGKKANPLGLFDAHGNAAEWVADDYEPYPGCQEPAVTPLRVARGVTRGGSFSTPPSDARAAARAPLDPAAGGALADVGFRIVMEIPVARPEPEAPPAPPPAPKPE